ncbi:hypothetical protein [Arthrobacter sp. fls2-241-R2A-172]|uniref:hypothetical protein n=1 Tax=Arthrobacter sp. fls2-241-R2A-172 TaxID=3040325 RepID=UPI002550923B|nr:hypothetical protein [Arthrobacter sp. fls2-241-R2A-172]
MSDQFNRRSMPLIQVTRDAENPRTGATLAELGQFIQEAERAGIDPRTPVLVRAGLGLQIKQIKTGVRTQ